MQIGSLVRVNGEIKEYVEDLGGTLGVVVQMWHQSSPELCEVLWSNGELERLYTDELEVPNEDR